MTVGKKGFLVIRRADGLGTVFPLEPGKRHVMGRAKTNEIALNDDMCSRQHAEVYSFNGRWRVRDLGSLNGTRVNDKKVAGEEDLLPRDEIGIGHSQLIFVDDLNQLPASPHTGSDPSGVAIKRRMAQTSYDLPLPSAPVGEETPTTVGDERQRLKHDFALLYRLALDMGAATTYEELLDIVLKGLLEATAADTAAILVVRDGGVLRPTARRNRVEGGPYLKLSDVLRDEVFRTRQALLAEDEARLQEHGESEAIEAFSVICAPVLVGEHVDSLVQLYCTDPLKVLTDEDLELTVAISKQLAVASQTLQRQVALREENEKLKAQVTSEVQLVGNSGAIKDITAQITKVAVTNATVLIRGESGVGKELVARAIHLASPRRQGPFVCLNCAALAESLLESELFGHEKGAFTGATERKIGKFEAAHQGTIFLDEIGEMNPGAQAKFLRVLEGHPYERIGGHDPIKVNVRVVAATNRPLEEAVKAGQFRRDLYFRLQVVEVTVPPLRERKADIPLLADYFLKKFLSETGRRIKGFTQAALDKLIQHTWPGNIRELRNVMERAVALGTGSVIDAGDIWLSSLESVIRPDVPTEPQAYVPQPMDAIERRHILDTLQHTDWNKSRAAEILGIERSTLDRKIKAFDLKR